MCVKSENEMKRPLSERPGTEDKRDCSHVSVFLMVTVMATFTVLRVDFMVNILTVACADQALRFLQVLMPSRL
jgi:hypothetical protein